MNKLSFFLVGLCLAAMTSSAATYYVWGGSGKDSNDGSAMTSAKAWATLAHADDVVGPGDRVCVKGTFADQQSLNSSSRGNGTAAAWVVYQAYDETPVNFIGADSGIRMDGKRYVEIAGAFGGVQRFRFYQGIGNGMYVRSACSYVRIRGCDFNPTGLTARTGGGIRVFEGANHIWICENRIESGLGSDPTAVYLGTYGVTNDCSYVYVHNNQLIASTGEYDCNAVDIKELYGAPEIWVYSNTVQFTALVSFGAIEIAGSCRIFGNTFDLSGSRTTTYSAPFYIWCASPTASTASIYRNTIIGGCSQAAVFTVVSDFPGLNVNFYNNVVRDFTGANNALAAYLGGGRLGQLRMYHNTFYNCPGMRGDNYSSNPSQRTYAKNNVFLAWGAYALTDASNMDSAWDGNMYYKTGTTASTGCFAWNTMWDGPARSFSYMRGLSQESHGIFGTNPQLDANARPTQRLPAGLDVSAEMTSWPDYNQDRDGHARSTPWDVGAFQVQAVGAAIPAPPGNLRVIVVP